MKNLKTFIFITILIVVVIIVIIINIMSNLGVTINKNRDNEIVSEHNNISNEIYVTKSGEIKETDKTQINWVQKNAEKYFLLLNAYYGEENEYTKTYSKQQIKQMLYDLTLKQKEKNIDNFDNDFEIKEKTEYYFDNDIFKIEDEKIIKYFIGVAAALEGADGLSYFRVIIYVDKTTGSYAIFYGSDNNDLEYPEIHTIERNTNNEY